MRHRLLMLTLLAAGCAPAAHAEPAAKPVAKPTAGAAQAPATDAAASEPAAGSSGAAPGALQFDAASVVFHPAPPTMPKGVELAVLEGNPRAPGIFTLRLKAPPGFLLPPHTHPVEERVTVLSGSVAVGFGTRVERKSARTFGPGAFYVNPPGAPHYVFSGAGAVVQITGVGPWRVEPIAPPGKP
jgi:mannose-6-phosphate isomerase-like protein (cupin superfamily)